MVRKGLPRYARDKEKSLLDHPHIRPVILELVSAVQADHVMLAGRGGHVPVRVYGAPVGRCGGKRLGNLLVRTANREQLKNFIDHWGLLFCRTRSGVLPEGSTLKRANGTAF